MTPKPEEVLKLASDIVKATKVLEDLQARWDAIFPSEPKPVPAPTRAIRESSFASRVEAVVVGQAGLPLTIAQVAAALGTTDTLKVGRTLFRLYSTKRIANPERGRYSAKTQMEIAA
jgi:hypothetical protein